MLTFGLYVTCKNQHAGGLVFGIACNGYRFMYLLAWHTVVAVVFSSYLALFTGQHCIFGKVSQSAAATRPHVGYEQWLATSINKAEYDLNFFTKRHGAEVFYRIYPLHGGKIRCVALVFLVNSGRQCDCIGVLVAATGQCRQCNNGQYD